MATENLNVQIISDPDAENPRKWDNLGVMVCAHRRYDLGDGSGLQKAVDFIRERVSESRLDAIGFDESNVPSIEQALLLTGKVLLLPLYLYDHSGITISTTPFSCPFDSGKVGFIFITYPTAIKEFGWDYLSSKRKQQMYSLLTGEVQVYDQYLKGDVWGYQVLADGEVKDSCWGFYGSDLETNGILDNLCEDAKALVKAGQYERRYS